MDITSMVSHFVQNFHNASGKPINNVTMTAEAPFEQPETIEKNGFELEDKEIIFIGPRLPRVMTKEEVKALFRELFPNSDKYK